MNPPGSPLLALSLARIRTFIREPGAVFWTFGFPLLITVALGVAFRTQGPAQISVAVIEGPGSSRLAADLRADPAFVVRVVDAASAAGRLRTGEALVVVEAGPPRTAADVAASPPAPMVVVYRFDPSRPEASGARRAIDDRLQRAAGRRDRLTTRDEVATARGARYVDWLVPGLLGMQLLSGALWGTTFNIVTARQRKLLKRLAATPMRRRDYLLSFRVAGLVFVPVQVAILFAFARVTFGVVIHGSPLAVLGLSLLASWSFAGLGLLCAARAQNTETANGLVNLVSMPMFVLSGVFFTSSRFPSVVQPAIRLLPLSAFNEALRHVVNDGASFASQGFALAVLVGWGLTSSLLALRVFRWT